MTSFFIETTYGRFGLGARNDFACVKPEQPCCFSAAFASQALQFDACSLPALQVGQIHLQDPPNVIIDVTSLSARAAERCSVELAQLNGCSVTR